MGFFDRLQKRNTPEPTIEERSQFNSYSNTMFSSMFATNSAKVNEVLVMKIPTAVACLDLITNSIAKLPVYLYKENPDGSVDKILDDNRVFLLNGEPNEMGIGSAFNLKKQFIKDYLLYGGGYIKPEMQGNKVVELWNLPARNMFVVKFIVDGYKIKATYELATIEGLPAGPENIEPMKFSPYELMIALQDSPDGVTSTGILQKGEKILKQAYDEMEYTSNIFQRGALPLGILKMAGRLSQGAVDKLRTSWENLYSGSKNSAKTVILEEGMEYQPISMNPQNLQLNESKQTTASEICKLFGVPESMISTQQNKYNSIEQNQLNFLQSTLGPIITAFEMAIDKTMLLEKEKKSGYYFRFDTSEILRTTEKERIEAVEAGFKSGLFTFNESRDILDLPARKKDIHVFDLRNVFYEDESGKIVVPNARVMMNINDDEATFNAEVFPGRPDADNTGGPSSNGGKTNGKSNSAEDVSSTKVDDVAPKK